MPLLTDSQVWCVRALAVACAVAAGPVGCGDDTPARTIVGPAHVLRVQGNGGGSGTVTAPGASPALACTITRGALSGTCAGAYPSHSTVQLVAEPNGSSTFVGWSGSCTGTADCVVDMSGERTATASFAPASASARVHEPATR